MSTPTTDPASYLGPVTLEHQTKFHLDGTPKPYGGYTTLCHFHRYDALYTAIERLFYAGAQLPVDGATSEKYTRLPLASMHVTLLGVTEPLDTTSSSAMDREALTAAFRALRGEMGLLLPLKMAIDLSEERMPRSGHTLVIPLVPVDEENASRAEGVRRALQRAFGMGPLAEGYFFHVTVAYPLREIGGTEEMRGLREGWRGLVAEVEEEVGGVVVAERVEFCEYADMCHFEVLETVEVGGQGPA